MNPQPASIHQNSFSIASSLKVTAALIRAEACGASLIHEFDAVVTDQMMAKITGLVLAERIRETQLGLPIILLTGFAKIPLEEGELRSIP